jgi:hypothetical protein
VRKVNLQLLSQKGDIIEEDVIEMNDDDTLIFQFPPDESASQVQSVFELIKERFGTTSILAIPSSWSIKVLKKS